MVLIAWIIGLILGIGLGGVIATRIKSRCNHEWVLIESGDILNYDRPVGNYKFYECKHCKEMKKNEIRL
jgi:hypothetical protein